ncbi:MAG: hypothetical protein Q7R68_11180 [Nitrospirales bacterium]|nr:hypothetical protein [Nitrospirales bacterium]
MPEIMNPQAFVDKWGENRWPVIKTKEMTADLTALLAQREAEVREACATVAEKCGKVYFSDPPRINPIAESIAAAIRSLTSRTGGA